MTAIELLNQLRKLSFTISADDGRLIVRGPREGLPPALRDQLTEQKSEILALLKGSAMTRTARLHRVPRDRELCLSFAQQRLWFLDQLEPGKSIYNVPSALRLRGPLDTGGLHRSLKEIVRRHEALRTTFVNTETGPVQVVSSSPQITLLQEEIRGTTEEEVEAEISHRVALEGSQPFDLSRGPLLRAKLIRVAADDHVLLLTMHHIVSDGWSMGVLHRELSALYRAFLKNEPSPLAELPIQYPDFAIWQREWLKGMQLDQQLAYWKKQLDGIPTFLSLPTDRPRPAIQSFRGRTQSAVFGKDLMEALKAFNRREGVTMFMTLLAAFQTLLYRYTGQEDIVVGAAIANRNHTEVEGLIGFFVNALALRANFSHDPTFRDFLASVRQTALDAYEHQDLPFEKLVEELNPHRTLSYTPIFQVMFVLQNAPDSAAKLEGLNVSRVRGSSETAKFDLTLSVSETAEGLRLSLQYNTDLFEDATIARWLEHYEALLATIVHNPDCRLSEVSFLRDKEREQLLLDWNRTATEYPRQACVHGLFEAQVIRLPDKTALIYDEQQLSYAELNERANQLAHHLKEAGVSPGDLVGVCLERDLELIVALLGILKAGAAYLPLDPAYPKERLAFMLQDTGANLVLTGEDSRGSLPAMSGRVICLDRDWKDIAKQPSFNPISRNTADDLAYVIYTSGSTGVPKGVKVSHRAIARLLFGVDYVQLGPTQILLHLAPISFDAATFEVWGALLHGGTCILFPWRVPSSTELGEVLKKTRVDTLWLTAALFNTVIDEQPEALSEIKHLLIGGEALSVAHVRKALARLPNTKIINGYGPTEGTTFTCCYRIPRQLEDNVCSIPIGRPIGNTQVYILDSHLEPVPIGVTGELYIGGDGLALGYWNRPELTAERFINHCFDGQPEQRLYKTGDLARYLSDGNIDFIGRSDNQVKLRGYRIELGEIETVLAQHPAVQQVVVLAREDTPDDKRLVAYVVAADGTAPSTHDLRGYLQKKLPDYMVPSTFVLLETLPLTPSGKIDNKSLLASRAYEPTLNDSYLPPKNFTENTIKKIWQAALGVEGIGVNDNFFDLGGHSLLTIKVLSQLNQFYKLDLKPRCLFEFPTIAQLAEHIRNGNFSNSHENSRWSHLVELQATNGNHPVFFVPGGAGGEEDLLRCMPLLRRISLGHSIFALLSWNLRGATTVAKIAEQYLQEVRTVQPKGPYFLIGECVSGIVAYEMAQQLVAQGQGIASLTLLDTVRPTKRRYFSFVRNYYLKRMTAHRNHLQLLSLRETISYSLRMAKTVIFPMNRGNGSRVKNNYLGGGYAYDKILMSYSPQKSDFRMNLILSTDVYDRRCDGGWAGLVPASINVVKNNALHVTYCTDHVDETATHLRKCLAMAQEHARELP